MVLACFGISFISEDIIRGILIVTARNLKIITTRPKIMTNQMIMNIHMVEPNRTRRYINSWFLIKLGIGQPYLLHQKIRPPKKNLHKMWCLYYHLQAPVTHMISPFTKQLKMITLSMLKKYHKRKLSYERENICLQAT